MFKLGHYSAVQGLQRAFVYSSSAFLWKRLRPEERRGDAEELGAVPRGLEDSVLRAGGRLGTRARGAGLLPVRSEMAGRVECWPPEEHARVPVVMASGEARSRSAVQQGHSFSCRRSGRRQRTRSGGKATWLALAEYTSGCVVVPWGSD